MSSKRFWIACTSGMALITLLAAWGLSYIFLQQYTQSVADRLQLLNELRKGALENYFSTAKAELNFWSSNPEILNTQIQLNNLWQAIEDKPLALQKMRHFYVDTNPFPSGELRSLDDAADGSPYSALHRALHPRAKLFVTERGYYDVFLIGRQGTVFYTVEKESDYGTNLLDGKWRDTGLAEVYRKAIAEPTDIVISDMEAYRPSSGAPAIFIATALTGSRGEPLGVIAFQLPTSHILSIMNYTSGMGETGETYLVGQDNIMRSDSRFTEASAVIKQSVDTATVNKALAAQSGVEYVVDYRDIEVLSAYTNIEVGDTSWAVMAEIDRAEVRLGAAHERPNLTGILLFFFSLSLWSAWYWRSGQVASSDADFADLGVDFESGNFDDSMG
ncbi:MAG: cache domain-containing protein [Halioglobus sp.]